MRRMNRILKTWTAAVLLAFPQSSALAQTQNSQDIVECNKVVVKDYALPELVQRLFQICGKKLEYMEDILNVKVTVNFEDADFKKVFGFLGDKTGLAFQPVNFVEGKFETTGYVAGAALKPDDTWFVCQTTNETPAKGKSRIYRNPANNEFRIVMNQAPVKEMIDRLHRLFGSAEFTQGVVNDLKTLNIDLASNAQNFKASLDHSGAQLNLAMRRQLNQKLFQVWGARNTDSDVEIWPLTYIGGRRQSAGTGQSGGNSNRTEDGAASYPDIDEILNWAFADNTAKLYRQNLFISGSKETRLKVKRLLAKIDAPWPQVQMNMWAIQVSGKPEKIGPQLLMIKRDIALTQAAMVKAQLALNALLNKRSEGCTGECKDALDKLCKVNFSTFDDTLSLNEALILLALHNESHTMVEVFERYVSGIQQKLSIDLQSVWNGYQGVRCGPSAPPATALLRRMKVLYTQGAQDPVRKAVSGLAEALINFNENKDDSDGPEELLRSSAVADRLLKGAIDAYAADMQEVFLDPLLDRIQALNGGCKGPVKWSDEGVALTGRTRIVVTSRLHSTLEPVVKSYANVSRPKPLGQDFLNKAFPNNKDGKAAPGAPLLGLEAFPALLLAAGLSEEKPVFNEVAPGVRISVRPTVISDGTSARLELDCSFGVTTKVLGNQEDVWGQTKADAVESHRISTDAAVSVFDLFDISSFSIDSSHPQAPFYVPVLGRLPIVGPAFQWPRDKKRVHHESIILVNTVILPRALDLARYYGN
jgi:hypothetical protein